MVCFLVADVHQAMFFRGGPNYYKLGNLHSAGVGG